jgi:glycosyltransferase involved in cell wall biosynthesis
MTPASVNPEREVSVSSRPPGLKVCHVFAGTEGGRWVYEQLLALRDEHGCDVHALLGGTEGGTVDLCRRAGIEVTAFDFSFGGWRALFSIPWRIVKLAWWMRRHRFDVVQSHVIQSTLFARPAAWLADVPVRLTMVTGPFYMQAPTTRRLEKSTVWMETGIVPSCDLTARLYREAGLAEERILPTLYYGPRAEDWDPQSAPRASLRAEFGLSPEAKLIGCVAIFYPRCGAGGFIPPETHHRQVKGHEDLIRAMPIILQRFPEARLLLFGKGWGPAGAEAEAELRALAKSEGLDHAVIFAGYRSDIASVYRDLDVSVQASLNENLGGTVESLLMACPTVATRVGGMTDSVVDGETGFLVSPANPQDLARGIIEMLACPARARRLGDAGRARMLTRFTLDKTAAGLAAVYREGRATAPGAFRPWVSLGRLARACVLHPPVLGRALIIDLQFGQRLPIMIANMALRLAHWRTRLSKLRRLIPGRA